MMRNTYWGMLLVIRPTASEDRPIPRAPPSSTLPDYYCHSLYSCCPVVEDSCDLRCGVDMYAEGKSGGSACRPVFFMHIAHCR